MEIHYGIPFLSPLPSLNYDSAQLKTENRDGFISFSLYKRDLICLYFNTYTSPKANLNAHALTSSCNTRKRIVSNVDTGKDIGGKF